MLPLGYSNLVVSAFERHRAAIQARLERSGLVRPGPDSITWRIHREVVVITSWGRAILLQLAHPAIAAGVDGHSGFRGSLLNGLRRGRSTVRAMLAFTFGDREQMVATAAGINALHDRVRGRGDESTGAAYSAHDPDLQRWVHATLVESVLLSYERLVGPLTRAERDRYCAEQAALVEPLFGMPAGWLPRHSAELDSLHARHARQRKSRRDRHQPGARSSRAVPAPVVSGLAGVSGDAAAHDWIASAVDPPGLRIRLARARRTGARALDGTASHITASASVVRARVAGGEADRRG